MSKINEYPQAVTINNNDLFVIDQESGGDHATKSASVSQIADKATSGVQSQIGDLSQLTTTDKSSLVGAVNEVNGKGYNDLSGRPIRTVVLNSTKPATIQGQVNAGYATFIIVGFVASLGGVVIAVQMTGGNLTKTIDLLTGNNFTSTHLTFSTSSNRLVMNSDVAQDTTLMIFG